MALRSSHRKCVLAVACALACACSGGSSITPNSAGWWRDKVAYEIFVRSFADSNGDGTGDLNGLTARLDYLNDGDASTTSDLGIDAIWLMPIYPSPSSHGYDVTDYRGVNPQYGSMADLDALVQAAHRRGIRVLLDMVLDHSSDRHPWFVNAETGPSAAHRDWYTWSATDPGWRRPWDGAGVFYAVNGAYYYGLFCGCMPNLNLANPAVEQEMTATMKFWLSHGVDGFRLDAARHFFHSPQGDLVDQPGTHAFLKRLRAALQADYPQALLVAEAWTNVETVATYAGDGDEVQLAFSFELADAIKAGLVAGNTAQVSDVLARSERSFADRGVEAPFLSNHDQVRVLRALAGDAPSMRVAAATLFALPGTPFIYYGEEIGMLGGAGSSDLNKRTTLHWTAAGPDYGFGSTSPWNATSEPPGTDVASQQADPSSLWNLYRRLVALRHAQPALATGDATRPAITGGAGGLVALLRTAGTARVLFVANYAAGDSGPFAVATPGTPSMLESQGLSGAPSSSGGQLAFPGLAGRSFVFLSL